MMNEKYVDQTLNIASIRSFLLHRESIILFLALTCAFTILLVVFGQPTSLTDYTYQHTPLTKLGQISITFVSGFFLLVISRVAMFLAGRKHNMQLLAISAWMLAELILEVTVMALVLWAISGAGKVRLDSLVGTLVLGYLGVLLVPAVVSFLIFRLHEDQLEITRLRHIVASNEPSSIQQQDSVVNFYAKAGKLSFSTKLSNLLYLEGADNYINIHYLNSGKEDTFILFNTLKNIERQTENTTIMRCHRRYMVNVQNVRLLRKENSGIILELNHSPKIVPVSKSFAEPITRYFAYNTNMPLPAEK
jgi:hypothetical protein